MQLEINGKIAKYAAETKISFILSQMYPNIPHPVLQQYNDFFISNNIYQIGSLYNIWKHNLWNLLKFDSITLSCDLQEMMKKI